MITMANFKYIHNTLKKDVLATPSPHPQTHSGYKYLLQVGNEGLITWLTVLSAILGSGPAF